jgi:hypothetical protein
MLIAELVAKVEFRCGLLSSSRQMYREKFPQSNPLFEQASASTFLP